MSWWGSPSHSAAQVIPAPTVHSLFTLVPNNSVFAQGAFPGNVPQDACFVRCGRDTMTQDDIDHGRLIVLVGFAPARPAEFVILRIGQWRDDDD